MSNKFSDNAQDAHEQLPLDTARNTFTLLVTGPDPLSINGHGFPGLPRRRIPLDELRDRLLDRRCPRVTRDAVWRHLIHRARRDGATWTVACVGMALPGLAATARWLAARYRGDRADIHASVLTGFLAALATLDLRDPGVPTRLHWAARRAGHATLAESLDAPMPSLIAFESRAPQPSSGHPDLVLARLVADDVLTPTEAELISATRIGEESVTAWAHAHGRSVHAVAKARERAEHRLRAYLTDPDRTMVSPDSTDPVADAALATLTSPAGSADGPDTTDLSLAVSGRRRNGRPVDAKKSSRLVSKTTPESGLLIGGDTTSTAPRADATPSSPQQEPPMRVTPPDTTAHRQSDTPPEAVTTRSDVADPTESASHRHPMNLPMPTGRHRGYPLRRTVGVAVMVATLSPLMAMIPAHAETTQVLALASSVSDLFTNIRNWLMGILAGLATVFFTVGGVRYLMADGDPGEIEAAKRAWRNAGKGYALAALAPLVVTILQGIVGA